MELLVQFLESIHPLSDGLKDQLATIVRIKEMKKKDMLLRAGHICRNIYFIEEGLLRCYYSVGDTEVSSWFMKEGDVMVSIESFFQQKPSYESIQALEDCFLYYIEYKELQLLYKQFPEFNFTGRVLTEKYYTLWAQQLFALRMHSAMDRYNWLLNSFSELILRVPAKYIASYLGITEAHLSVIKGKL